MKNLICALLGHKWRDTSSRQYVKINGTIKDCWVTERHCDRCGIDERDGAMPTDVEYAMLAGSVEPDKKVVGIKQLLGVRKPSQVYRDVMIGYDFDTVKKFSELARFTGEKTLDDSK